MTTYKKYDELNRISNEIENDIERAMTDPKILSDLSVRVQSLSDMLKNQEKNAKINSLVIRCNFFKRKIKEFSNQRILERNNIENEMKTARLKTRKISEVNLEGQNMSEDNFYQAQSNVIDNFILTTMDSLNSLKKQNVLIERTNARFINVLKRIGISGDLIRNMERRVGKDRSVFIFFLIFFIIFFILLKIFW